MFSVIILVERKRPIDSNFDKLHSLKCSPAREVIELYV